MRPLRGGLDYAIVGPNSPLLGPQGNVQRLELDYSSGFRTGGGYRLPGGSGRPC